jgi:hypothetical protein
MLEPGTTSSAAEFIIDVNTLAFRGVKALEVRAALEDGVDPFVRQAIASI